MMPFKSTNPDISDKDLCMCPIDLKKKIGVYEISSNSWTDLGKLSDFSKAFKDFN